MITWKLLSGEGDFFGAGNEPGFSPHLQSFPQAVGLVEGVGQSIHDGGNKQNERRRKFFGKMGNTGGIIQGDNYAGHCFALRDLILMNFF